jgi:hypothetical protein
LEQRTLNVHRVIWQESRLAEPLSIRCRDNKLIQMPAIWTTWFLTLVFSPVLMSVPARSSTSGLQLLPRFMSMLASSDLLRTHSVASSFARAAHDEVSQAEPRLELLDDWGGESLPHARMGADNLDLRSIIEAWLQLSFVLLSRGLACMQGGLRLTSSARRLGT